MKTLSDIVATILWLITICAMLAAVVLMPYSVAVWNCVEHDFWLVDPSYTELEAVSTLEELGAIRKVYMPSSIEHWVIDDKEYCIVKFLTNTQTRDGAKAREYMDSKGINYFRTEEEVKAHLGYYSVENLYKMCEGGQE